MDVRELISTVDIVSYIGQYADLQERNGEYWCLSLFKEEKTPSFSVRRDPPVFYDYSSGKGGNILTFIKEFHHVDNATAIQLLCDYAGYNKGSLEMRPSTSLINVAKRYRSSTNEEKTGPTPLSPHCMDIYEDDPSKYQIWIDEGISADVLKEFGVKYDVVGNRLVYPIMDTDGNIVNIGGRTLDPLYKEKQLRKYTYYHKWGSLAVIYGLHHNLSFIKEANQIILFEGMKSVLNAYSHGIKNTGAILTSHLNPRQMKELAKLRCPVVFALDKDVDVMQDKHIRSLSRYVDVYYLKDTQGLLDDKDAPIDKGAEVFNELYQNKVHYHS